MVVYTPSGDPPSSDPPSPSLPQLELPSKTTMTDMVLYDPTFANLQRGKQTNQIADYKPEPYSGYEMDGCLDIAYNYRVGGRMLECLDLSAVPLNSSDPENGISMGSASDQGQVGVYRSGAPQMTQLIPRYDDDDDNIHYYNKNKCDEMIPSYLENEGEDNDLCYISN